MAFLDGQKLLHYCNNFCINDVYGLYQYLKLNGNVQAIQFYILPLFFCIISRNNSNNMFSHLCMKYIFFLLAITTIVAGRICTDPNYPVRTTTFCRNQNTFACVCESLNSLDYKIVDVPCEPDETCVDFARPKIRVQSHCVFPIKEEVRGIVMVLVAYSALNLQVLFNSLQV
jgi:hypothetical protein